MCPAAGFHLILSPQDMFVLFLWYSFLPVSHYYIHLVFCYFLRLSTQTHTLLLMYTHTLSLGYYQDKSIWSIQGSGCHFIHIFSSLVTLLKDTASIYPEWMNALTDETRRENEAHTAWNDHSQSVCHFQTCSQILCFTCNRKQLGEFEAFGTMFSIHLWMRRQRAVCLLLVTREWLLRLPAWGGNEMLQSGEAQCRESWRRDKNVSIHANWCPDPPPGCHCLLSGERIKGPFTKHKDFNFFCTVFLSPLQPVLLVSFNSLEESKEKLFNQS